VKSITDIIINFFLLEKSWAKLFYIISPKDEKVIRKLASKIAGSPEVRQSFLNEWKKEGM